MQVLLYYYYSNLINNNNSDSQGLFSTVNRFLQPTNVVTSPTTEQRHNFLHFFHNKIDSFTTESSTCLPWFKLIRTLTPCPTSKGCEFKPCEAPYRSLHSHFTSSWRSKHWEAQLTWFVFYRQKNKGFEMFCVSIEEFSWFSSLGRAIISSFHSSSASKFCCTCGVIFLANAAGLLASLICSVRILQKLYDLSSHSFLLFFSPDGLDDQFGFPYCLDPLRGRKLLDHV